MEKLKVAVFLADGFEEVEAVTILDFLRRADIEALAVSVYDQETVKGKHQIVLKSDLKFSDFIQQSHEFAAFATPGGNIEGLLNHEALGKFLKDLLLEKSERFLASICASPLLLEKIGLAEQFEGTCYPSVKEELSFAKYIDEAVVCSEKLITSQGPATSLSFTLALVERLRGKEKAQELARASLFEKFYQ